MTKKNDFKIGQCKLCLKDDTTLVDSHIIPDFVFRWLKKNSFNRYLRTSIVPNKRAQGGITEKLLCEKCDNVTFGGELEAPFADTIFNPILLKQKDSEPFIYDKVLLRFCVSVLWRVLIFGIEDAKKTKGLTVNLDTIILGMEDLANQWREYLVDNQSSWTGLNVYFLRFGGAGLDPRDIGPGMHTYSQLTIDMGSFVDPYMWEPKIYAKLGPFVTFIPITDYYLPLWEKEGISSLNENGGLLSFKGRKLPEHFKLFMQQRSDSSSGMFQRMSDIQKSKILKIKNENLIEYEQSDEYLLAIKDIQEINLHDQS
ncbi:hypothetical protein DYI81_06665 [Acinetobacter sp. SWAC5]|uniref:hypothetical protein n=1 Tax=Acinetobacter sp. SWAC5 TaxID=2293835 RepID=UPI000E344D69|nr:hypothetical protein [Acinetobacter sp. SWAC5]RFS32188.1 hypothetical protein DYI81_06665 [Acinetobacter sp. SWAC5]